MRYYLFRKSNASMFIYLTKIITLVIFLLIYKFYIGGTDLRIIEIAFAENNEVAEKKAENVSQEQIS